MTETSCLRVSLVNGVQHFEEQVVIEAGGKLLYVHCYQVVTVFFVGRENVRKIYFIVDVFDCVDLLWVFRTVAFLKHF